MTFEQLQAQKILSTYGLDSFIETEIKKAETFLHEIEKTDLEKGGKRAMIGETRIYGGKKWVKHADGWVYLAADGKHIFSGKDGHQPASDDHVAHAKKHLGIESEEKKEEPSKEETKTKVNEEPSKEAAIEEEKDQGHNLKDFDFDDYVNQKKKLHELFHKKLDKHNEKFSKTSTDYLWSYDDAARKYLEAAGKEINYYYYQKDHGLLKNLSNIEVLFPEADEYYKDNFKIATRQVKNAADLLSNKHIEEALKPLDKVLSKMQESSNVPKSNAVIDFSEVKSHDGKHGTFDVSVSFDGDSSSVVFEYLVTPNDVHMINYDDLLDSEFQSSKHEKLVDLYSKEVRGKGRKVREFNDHTEIEAQKIIKKIPSSNKYVQFKGSKIDNENGEITLSVDYDRAARHPDEFGAEGRKAERIADKWHFEFTENVVSPLKKLGYKIIYA